jgi:hypothetical protein
MPSYTKSIPPPPIPPAIDLSEVTEGTRRRLYDIVVAVHFTVDPGAALRALQADEWVPRYGPDECRLAVFHFAGRWFVIWRQWEEIEDDTPEEQEWFILTARPSLSAPFGVQFQEV